MSRTADTAIEFNRRTLLVFGAFLAVFAVFVAGLYYWHVLKRKQTEWERDDPMALVKELNLAHQLSDQERRLMQELSDKRALPSPLKIFIEPKFLLDALNSNSFVSARPLVRQLLSKLFDITDAESEISVVGTDSGTKMYVG